MGVLCDLVVGDVGDAERIGRSRAPAAEFGGLDIKGIDVVKLCQLHALLSSRALKELLADYDPVVVVSDEGPWVFRVPEDLVERVARLGEEERQSVAARWAETAELVMDRWKSEDVARVLDGIAGLAREAEQAGKTLFFWMRV